MIIRFLSIFLKPKKNRGWPDKQELKQEYHYLVHKHQLKGINQQFSFFRMRPSNFPTIRLAQLVALLHKEQNLFSKLIKLLNTNAFYELLNIEVNDFWKEHYTFETTSKKSNKKLSKDFIDLLIINTIIPLKYIYLQSINKAYKDELIAIMIQIKPEKNTIIEGYSKLNIKAKNALESQALIHLKTRYCNPKYCLKCAIGKSILGK